MGRLPSPLRHQDLHSTPIMGLPIGTAPTGRLAYSRLPRPRAGVAPPGYAATRRNWDSKPLSRPFSRQPLWRLAGEGSGEGSVGGTRSVARNQPNPGTRPGEPGTEKR